MKFPINPAVMAAVAGCLCFFVSETILEAKGPGRVRRQIKRTAVKPKRVKGPVAQGVARPQRRVAQAAPRKTKLINRGGGTAVKPLAPKGLAIKPLVPKFGAKPGMRSAPRFAAPAAPPLGKPMGMGTHLVGIGIDAKATSACSKLKNDAVRFFTKNNVLVRLGLSTKNGFQYIPSAFTKHAPHISLVDIPSSASAPKLIARLNPAMKAAVARRNVPTSFTFNGLVAFWPAAGKTVFIVARTPSNMSHGFRKLSDTVENVAGIKRKNTWFASHVTVGKIVTTGRNFTQADVNGINAALRGFKNLPRGNFGVANVFFSAFNGPKTVLARA